MSQSDICSDILQRHPLVKGCKGGGAIRTWGLNQWEPQTEDFGRNASIERDPARQTSCADGSARENSDSTGAAPIVDTTTHDILAKLAIAIMAGLLGTLSYLRLCLVPTRTVSFVIIIALRDVLGNRPRPFDLF
jgi:hypothetical protein